MFRLCYLVWGRTIQSLCLLGGTDVHFGFTEEAVCLTTYEPSITTYASLTFKDSFFSRLKDDHKGNSILKLFSYAFPFLCVNL